MRPIRTLLLAGAVIAAAGVALAATSDVHTLTVRLPDGSVEHIRYVGDRPPLVSVDAGAAGPALTAFDPFGPGSAFAQMRAMEAAMDRQAALMLQQAGATPPGPGGAIRVDLGRMPAGAQGFVTVSTMSSGGGCARSVQYTAYGAGKPQVVTRTSGDCRAEQTSAAPGPAAPPPAVLPHAGRMLETAYKPGGAEVGAGRDALRTLTAPAN